jgi:hypothetical protein
MKEILQPKQSGSSPKTEIPSDFPKIELPKIPEMPEMPHFPDFPNGFN